MERKQSLASVAMLPARPGATTTAQASEAKRVEFGRLADRNGKPRDVVLGYANRIRDGRFLLDGESCQLDTNDGPNHLHGGVCGFDKAVWKIDSVQSGSPAGVVLSHVGPDGDGGFPGTLRITATYSLDDRNELTLEYRATTDKPTVLNITNHSYFNLADRGDILGHRLTLFADAYTPIDATLLPTGERRNVAGTPFDFREPHAIGERVRDGHDEQILFGRGYDHSYIVRGAPGTLRLAAKLEDPASGRVLELLTRAPAVQFYSGNFLDGASVGKGGRIYRQGDAVCLEPQVFPDSPNHPDFPSARLNPGDTYANVIVWRFSTAGGSRSAAVSVISQ